MIGADVDLIKRVSNLFPKSIPIHIGSCGIVSWEQYAELLELEIIKAVSISNVHHMSNNASNALRNCCNIKRWAKKNA